MLLHVERHGHIREQQRLRLRQMRCQILFEIGGGLDTKVIAQGHCAHHVSGGAAHLRYRLGEPGLEGAVSDCAKAGTGNRE